MSSPPSSPRHASHRPEKVKRTYSSRVKQTRPSLHLPSQPSSSSTSSSIFTSDRLRASSPPPLTFARLSSPVIDGFSSSGFRIQTPELDDEQETYRTLEVGVQEVEVEADGEQEGLDGEDEARPAQQRKVLVSTGESNRPSNLNPSSETKSRSSVSTSNTASKRSRNIPGKQATLKSFFTFESQPKTLKPQPSSATLRVEVSGAVADDVREDKQSTATKGKPAPALQQLHLVPVRLSSTSSSSSSGFRTSTSRPSLLTTCSKCNMSYIRGGIGQQDEMTHKQHCQRVTEGIKWDTCTASQSTAGGSVTMTGGKLTSWRAGKGDKARKRNVGTGQVLDRNVEFAKGKGKDKAVGNVVCVDGYEATSDKRVMEILESVDTVLSAPALPDPVLSCCKIFLFTTCSPPPISTGKRLKPVPKSSSSLSATVKPVERVVGCVVVQPIQTALRVLGDDELREIDEGTEDAPANGGKRGREELVVIGEHVEGADDVNAGLAKDVSTRAVICLPERLPCKIGIHRIFTVPKYRGLGISKILLDVACERTIYGYTCDPANGEVAFSQPTSSGKALMDAWGGGHVRVFVEDEQQDPENTE